MDRRKRTGVALAAGLLFAVCDRDIVAVSGRK